MNSEQLVKVISFVLIQKGTLTELKESFRRNSVSIDLEENTYCVKEIFRHESVSIDSEGNTNYSLFHRSFIYFHHSLKLA